MSFAAILWPGLHVARAFGSPFRYIGVGLFVLFQGFGKTHQRSSSRGYAASFKGRGRSLRAVAGETMDTITKQQLMQQFLQRVDENRDMKGLEAAKDFKPLRVEGFAEPVGFVPAKMAPRFAAFEHVFQLGEDGGLLVLPSLKTMEQRTEAVREVTGVLREEGLVKGWRDELVVVTEAFDAPPAFLIERACLPIIGARGYGVHINGYVEDPATGEILLWVATRAKDKPTWPGMLDHIVAGQQPYGLSPMENVVKECYEEAGIAEPLAKAAVAVGAVSYNTVNSK
eukprot:scaffold1638_cov258-Pinguiococcus_pyrenoidosus.AAC.27